MVKKYCIVPLCKNSSEKTPEKLFFNVPKKDVRKKWLKAMRRARPLTATSTGYCCEDHFDLEEDMENYIKFKLVGASQLKLKNGVVPHKFECQNRCPKKPERSLVAKLKAKSRAEEVAQILANASQKVEEIYVVDPVIAVKTENIEVDPISITEENSNNDTNKLPAKRHQKIQVKLRNKVVHRSTQTKEKHVGLKSKSVGNLSKKSQTILDLCSKCKNAIC